jgi:hypothetical protein
MFLAEHLAVCRRRFSTLSPRRDVIGFHFVQFKMLVALWTDALLPLVCFPFVVLGEGADAEVPFVAV